MRRFHELLAGSAAAKTAQLLLSVLHGFHRGATEHVKSSILAHMHTLPSIAAARSSSAVLVLDSGQAYWEEALPTADAHVPAAGGAGTSAIAEETAAASTSPSSSSSEAASRPCAVAFDDIADCVLAVRVAGSDAGFDCIHIRLLSGRPAGEVHARVAGLQLQLGRVVEHMKEGCVSTQRRLSTGALDCDSIAGALVRAERGLADLLPALRECYPGVTFTVGMLHVLTTGSAEPALASFAVTHPRCQPFPLAIEAAAAIAGSAAPGYALEWTVLDGVEWLRDILPGAWGL